MLYPRTALNESCSAFQRALSDVWWEDQYLSLMQDVLTHGDPRKDRTGVGTRATFGHQLKFDLAKGFPAPDSKRLSWKAVVAELLWFMEGSSDERRLCEIMHGTRDPEKTTIWSGNANAPYWTKARFPGDIGRGYGVQWRSWRKPDGGSVDQLSDLVSKLKTNPTDRRMLLVSYNVGELDQMALPPCHFAYQAFVENGRLHARFEQRSVDLFLGLPFNLASYALLTHILARLANLEVGWLTACLGDTHVYDTHVEAVQEQVSRHISRHAVQLELPHFDSLDSVLARKPEDFKLVGYQPQASIFAPMAV